MPRYGVEQHDNDWGRGSESHCGRIPEYGGNVRVVPPDYDLGRRKIRPQHDRIRSNGCACRSDEGALLVVPRQQQLFREFADGLLQLSYSSVAEHGDAWRKRAEPHSGRIPDDLRDLPYNYELAWRDV